MKTISNFFTGICILGIAFFALNYPPTEVKADTTGVMPDYEVIDIEQHKHLMDTELGNYTKDDVACLVENMYFEARSDGYAGMYAVTMVVMNRVSDKRYPDTVCGVVHQGPTRESWKTRGKDVADSERKYWPIKNRCQFSWFCDGKSDDPVDSATWLFSLATANRVLQGDFADFTEGATHYHADSVHPYWADSLNETVVINNHLFYK